MGLNRMKSLTSSQFVAIEARLCELDPKQLNCALINTLEPTLSINQPLELEAFLHDWWLDLLDRLKLTLVVEMNDDVYALDWYQKFKLLWRPYLSFFEHLGPNWTDYFLSHPRHRSELRTWFDALDGEPSVWSRYLELAHEHALIRPVENEDQLPAHLVELFLAACETWTVSKESLATIWEVHLDAALKKP
jgi:hypothetical protein